jgi:hypothetical protein
VVQATAAPMTPACAAVHGEGAHDRWVPLPSGAAGATGRHVDGSQGPCVWSEQGSTVRLLVHGHALERAAQSGDGVSSVVGHCMQGCQSAACSLRSVQGGSRPFGCLQC